MRKNVAKGIVISIIIIIVTSVLKFYSNRYFVLNLGLETLGVIKIFEQILGYLSLAELGVGTAAMYSLYQPLVNKDYERAKGVLYTVEKLYARIIIIIFIMGCLATFLLPILIKDIIVDYKIILYWIMYLFNTCLSYILAKYRILYSADRRINFVKISEGSSFVVFKILQIISLIFFKSLFLFLLFLIFNTITNIIIFMIYYRYQYYHLRELKNEYTIDKSIIQDTKQLFVHKLSYIVLVNTDVIIIAYFASLKAVGLYASYLIILKTLFSFVESINSVIYPHIGAFIATNKKDIIYKRFKEINIIYLFTSLIIIITTYNLLQPFMKIWINNRFHNDSIPLFLCISYFLLIVKSNLEMFKKGSGFFKDIHIPIIEASLNLILSLILVKYIGVLGVVIATVVSQLICHVILKPIATYGECFYKQTRVYLKDYSKYVMYTIVSVVVSQLIINNLNLEITSFLDFIVSGFIIVILLGFINGLLFTIDKDFRKQVFYSINVIKNKIA